jgi:hypothetical protein
MIRLKYEDKYVIKNKNFWGKLIAYFPYYVTDRIENDTSNNSSIVACVFVAVAYQLQGDTNVETQSDGTGLLILR